MKKGNLFIRIMLFFNVAPYAMLKNSPLNYLAEYQQKSIGMAFVFLFEFVITYYLVILRFHSNFTLFKLVFLSLMGYHIVMSFVFNDQIEKMASTYRTYYNKFVSVFFFVILLSAGLIGFAAISLW